MSLLEGPGDFHAPDGRLRSRDPKGSENERVEGDREKRPGHDEALSIRRQDAEADPDGGEHERELPDLSQRRGDRERLIARAAEGQHDPESCPCN